MSEVKSRVVLVTGGSSGLGASIAKNFAKQGACLSLIAVDETNFDEVVQECKDLGAKQVLKIVTDLVIKENMEMVMKKTIDEFRGLDVLVNCAATSAFGTIRNVTLEGFDKTMNLNVRTPLYMTQLAIPHLEKTKGNIVNLSSISSTLYSSLTFFNYCLSKTALDRLTKMTALDLSSSGIRVNSVRPGPCDTPFLRNFAAAAGVDMKKMEEIQKEKNPLNQGLLPPQEIADAVTFLSSDEARMITGVSLPVDCGRSLLG